MARRAAGAFAILVAAALASPARADDAAADERIRLAGVRQVGGDFRGAARALEEAIRASESPERAAEARLALGLLELEARGDAGRALERLEAVPADAGQTFVAAQLAMARAEMALGRLDDARRRHEALSTGDPDRGAFFRERFAIEAEIATATAGRPDGADRGPRANFWLVFAFVCGGLGAMLLMILLLLRLLGAAARLYWLGRIGCYVWILLPILVIAFVVQLLGLGGLWGPAACEGCRACQACRSCCQSCPGCKGCPTCKSCCGGGGDTTSTTSSCDGCPPPEKEPHKPISVTKLKIRNRGDGRPEVDSGFAQAGPAVDFVMDWGPRADHPAGSGHAVTVTWNMGDGTTKTGLSVSHSYGAGVAGTRNVSVTAECNHNGDIVRASAAGLTVHVIAGIDVTRIGAETPPFTHRRLSFNDQCRVEGRAQPDAALPAAAQDMIDWTVRVGNRQVSRIDGAAYQLTLADPWWPTANTGWGPTDLRASINEFAPRAGFNERGELLQGAAAIIGHTVSIRAFFNATTSENPTADPNWYYYYRSYAGGTDYVYDGSLATSESLSGVAGSIKIAPNAYTGGGHLTFDHGHPGGRLRITGWSPTFRYLRYFMGVLPHERQHTNGQLRTGGGPNDPDSDRLHTNFEALTSLTDPRVADSATWLGPAVTDREAYAGGPVEKAGIDAETGAKDWAHPGTQWP